MSEDEAALVSAALAFSRLGLASAATSPTPPSRPSSPLLQPSRASPPPPPLPPTPLSQTHRAPQLRAYQVSIVDAVLRLYVGLAAAPKRARFAPGPAITCDDVGGGAPGAGPRSVPGTNADDVAALICAVRPPLVPAAHDALSLLMTTARGGGKAATPPPQRDAPSSALLYLPTGGGKTRVALECARWIVRTGGSALFVVNRTALIGQAASAARDVGLADVLCVCVGGGGARPCDRARERGGVLHVATAQALAARCRAAVDGSTCDESAVNAAHAGALPLFDLLILDEAHGSVTPSYAPIWTAARSGAAATRAPLGSRLVSELLHARPFVLGLTATPIRLSDGAALGRNYEVLVRGPTVGALVRARVLVRPRTSAHDVPVLMLALTQAAASSPHAKSAADKKKAAAAAVRSRGSCVSMRSHLVAPDSDCSDSDGETDDAARSSAALDRFSIALESRAALSAVIAAWRSRCVSEAGGMRTTLVFLPTISSAGSLARAFCDDGITAAAVDGSMPIAARAALYASLACGTLTVLCSVGVVSEGFDCPLVSAILLLRPTASRALYVQQLGRGLRSAPGKTDCIVLDFVGATLRHGPVTRPLLAVSRVDANGDAVDALGVPLGDGGDGGLDASAVRTPCALSARALPPPRSRVAPAGSTVRLAAAAATVSSRAWVCAGCGAVHHVSAIECDECDWAARARARAAAAAAHMKGISVPIPRKSQKDSAAVVASLAASTGVQEAAAPLPPAAPTASLPTPATVADEADGGLSSAFAVLAIAPTRSAGPSVATSAPPVAAASGVAATLNAGARDGAAPVHGATLATLGSPAYAEACRAFGLPVVSPARARTAWEKSFLLSVAALITPGVHHSWKADVAQGKAPSARQREIMVKLGRG